MQVRNIYFVYLFQVILISNIVIDVTTVQVMSTIGHSSDFEDDEQMDSLGLKESIESSKPEMRSVSGLSPVTSGEVSEPETELEEDQESKPYSYNKKLNRPRSTPLESKSVIPSRVRHCIVIQLRCR